jgi:HAD superfamily hydrolase (TIGR01450 family)
VNSTTLEPRAFSEIVQRYDVIFFDAYGVLKNSAGVITGVLDVLAWLSRSSKDVFVLTNDASRAPQQLATPYTHPQQGPLVAASQVISSGLLAKDFLRSRFRSGTVAYLGKPASAFYIEAAGLRAVPIVECSLSEDLCAIAMLDDEGFDWARDLNRVVNLLRRENLPVVVANPDLSYPVGGDEVALAVGSLAAMVQSVLKRTFIRFGKPDTMMFSHAFACAHENRNGLTKEKVLMVGDTLHTDILGANTFGIDTALVLSGNTRRADAAVEITSSGVIPTYVCDSILT